MDSRIENLKSTTFGGRRFTRKDIAVIQQTADKFSKLSRRELGHTVCELLAWHTPKGENKIQSCLGALESLEELGVLSLPKKDASKKRGPQKKIIWTSQTDEQPLNDDGLNQLTPISLQIATEKDDITLWNEMVDRYHYLGYRRPIGAHLRYFIVDKHGRKLGCLMFSFAAKSLPCRDEWIGWQDKAHKKHLNLVVNNNRFLILPWVKVKCLASKTLSIARRQLADDWHERYGYRPVLMETFVDLTKFSATCYRAANWQYLGKTQKRAATNKVEAKTEKGVYVYPLVNNAKSILIKGPESLPKKPSIAAPKPLTSTAPFVLLWQNIIGTVEAVANGSCRVRQRRCRRCLP